jgi:hypothetical protein
MVLGALLVLALNESIRAPYASREPWVQWTLVGVVAVLFGLQCQILMIGAQGAFAQVLPVPGGRSIRGRAAVLGGWLLIVWFAAASISVVLWMSGMFAATLVLQIIAVAALLAAIATYIWSLPAAMADFGDDRRR